MYEATSSMAYTLNLSLTPQVELKPPASQSSMSHTSSPSALCDGRFKPTGETCDFGSHPDLGKPLVIPSTIVLSG